MVKRRRSSGPTFQDMMRKKEWKPLPSVTLVSGSAAFLKELFVKRFEEEVFGDAEPVVERFRGPPNDTQVGTLPLAKVLDELRTPSFFSPYRIVVIENASTFLFAHGDSLAPFVENGFAGGYLIGLIDGNLDKRRKIAKHIEKHGLVVDCAKPYDRPPPWETRTPVWDSELSQWVVQRAKTKNLDIDLKSAFALHERAGTDLATLDEELEKIVTVVTSRGSRQVTREIIVEVVGETRESSVFLLVELFLEGRLTEALREARDLFQRGFYSQQRGVRTTDPTALALIFVGTMIPRLRAIRRAHTMRGQGATEEDWVRSGLVQRPFLSRFSRQVFTVSSEKVETLFKELYDLDRAIKTGGDAEKLLELILIEHTGNPHGSTNKTHSVAPRR